MMWFFIASAKAIFAGWMVGCLCLPRLLLVFNQAQLLVGSICGLLLVAISTITVPHLTNGSLWMFTLVRFVYGIFMNMVLLETIYIQEAMPEGFGIPALVSINVVFCCVDIFQAYLCGGPMFYWDWRLQAGVLYSVPLVLSLYIGFPNWWDILCSIPNSSKRLFTSEASSDAAKELHTTLSAKEPKRVMFGTNSTEGIRHGCFIVVSSLDVLGMRFSKGCANLLLSTLRLASPKVEESLKQISIT